MQGNEDLGNKLASTIKSISNKGYVPYALVGYSFTAHEIFQTFPNKTITTPQANRLLVAKSSKSITRFVQKMFLHAAEIVILDIIENSYVFHLPNTNKHHSVLKIVTYRGEEVIRKKLKYIVKGLDMTKTFFTVPLLKLFVEKRGRMREVSILLSPHIKLRLIEKANSGFMYKEGKDVDIDYYVDKVYEAFPMVTKHDIRKILLFGWRGIARFIGYNGDILLKHENFFVHFGAVTRDNRQLFLRYLKKLSTKLRVLANRKRFPYDGYYYFWLTAPQYQRYCETGELPLVTIFLYYELCYLDTLSRIYIMRIKMPKLTSLMKAKYQINKDQEIELYIERPTLTYNTLRVTKNEYKILKAKPLRDKKGKNEEKSNH